MSRLPNTDAKPFLSSYLPRSRMRGSLRHHEQILISMGANRLCVHCIRSAQATNLVLLCTKHTLWKQHNCKPRSLPTNTNPSLLRPLRVENKNWSGQWANSGMHATNSTLLDCQCCPTTWPFLLTRLWARHFQLIFSNTHNDNTLTIATNWFVVWTLRQVTQIIV